MNTLAKILGVESDLLKRLDKVMVSRVGRKGILEAVNEKNNAHVRETFHGLNIPVDSNADRIHGVLLDAVRKNEKEMLMYLKNVPGATQFEKAAHLAKRI